MNRLRNPFTPTFGMVPPHLAGRSALLDEIADAFDNGVGAPSRRCAVPAISASCNCLAGGTRKNVVSGTEKGGV